ncbi:MAG: hypothetical protein KA190_12870 [Kofleriaceae bacterium]|nr:hypothetical protein [Kofleriaceae bacterium]
MSRYLEPAHVAATFSLVLSKRYLRFLAKERADLGPRFARLPTYEHAMPVAFAGAALDSFFHDDWPADDPSYGHPSATEAELGGAGGWVPLATIGDEEPQFLVVRAGDEACPVAMWEHETGGFVPCAASLDAFLEVLGKTARAARLPKSKVKLDKVLALADSLQDLAKAGPSPKRTAGLEAGLAALAPMLAAMPHRSTMDPDDATVPGQAHLARGVALRALGRYEEALEALMRAPIDGVPRLIAPLRVAELLLVDLDRPAEVIALCAAQPDPVPLLRRSWGLALLRLGQIDEAAAQLDLVVERQVDATLKLMPKADRATETTKRRAALVAAVRDYAGRHQLDASALLARLA